MRKESDLPFHIVVSGAIVYDEEQKFLIIKRSADEAVDPNFWSFPGGKLELDADLGSDVLEQNCHEEVLEETGIMIQDLHYLTNHSFVGHGYRIVVVMFLAKYKGGEARAQEGEVSDVTWLSFEEIKNLSKDLIQNQVFSVYEMAYRKLNSK